MPLPEMLARLHLPDAAPLASSAMAQASIKRQFLGPYLPLAQSLEWELSELHWVREGVLPFVDGMVPYLINNDGRLSADAASVLFANCMEAAPAEGPIRVAELGAGTGLFARYFLDEFQDLCERESRDFYRRLTYFVTDRSPRAVEQWQERGIFAPHEARVTARVCTAQGIGQVIPGPLRAVFCNYVLDVLPPALLRHRDDGWQQLCQRAWIPDNPALLRRYTPLNLDEIRRLACAPGEEERSRLLPLFPLIENDADFFPVGPDALAGLGELDEAPSSAVLIYNYAAIDCLDSLLAELDPAGFILINDYGPVDAEKEAAIARVNRFGPAIAVGLNFRLMERLLRNRGAQVATPEGDDGRKLHARLVTATKIEDTRRAFDERFAASVLDAAEAAAGEAREMAENGRWREALEGYRILISRNPRSWMLISEAADFAIRRLRDYAAGLELARAAVELNPWYSPAVWNVLGDALAANGKEEQAHEAYLQSRRIHPGDVETSLKLARSWRLAGNPAESLAAVARGLANDSTATFRSLLLDEQEQSIAALTARWNEER